MLFEILLAAISISPISACTCPENLSILNCNTINPGNTTVKFEKPMTDGDELILTGKFFEQNQFSKARAIFDLSAINGATILHFRQDFQTRGQREKILMNSRIGGRWGEVQLSATPYKPGQDVVIHVKKTDDIYEITLTDGVVLTFPHRLAASENPVYFSYQGDWTVSSIQMNCCSDEDSE
ncbi:unnamed protein product [Caenorhabditis bovis]|uniref:Galectin n=1 Tax=Caenorhabditis bovis TaxID=2654633 RepID=A0A8S1EQ05_9PELO|nr:unnamed protein product [Caenorhabditis bovis]